MKKIGIFGGTFNPPHIGHINAVEQFKKSLNLDKIIIIPSGIPPHKRVEGEVNCQDRLNMTKLAFPNYEVLDIEIKKEDISYTVDTLKYLKEQEPNVQLYFLIGSDMFLIFDLWYKPKEICNLCTIVAVARDKKDCEDILTQEKTIKKKYNADVKVINITPVELSSTELREKIKNNIDVKGQIPKEVLAYIKKKGLYNK